MAVELGKAYVTVEPSTQGLKAKLKKAWGSTEKDAAASGLLAGRSYDKGIDTALRGSNVPDPFKGSAALGHIQGVKTGQAYSSATKAPLKGIGEVIESEFRSVKDNAIRSGTGAGMGFSQSVKATTEGITHTLADAFQDTRKYAAAAGVSAGQAYGIAVDSAASMKTRMGGALKGLGASLAPMAGMAGAAVGTAFGAGLIASLNNAGRYEQSLGGVEAVFKNHADVIVGESKRAADAYGLSVMDYQENALVLGAMLKNQGLNDYVGETVNLMNLSGDLAARFGGTTKEAVEAIGAALRGEYDPLEKFGVSLNETKINAELAAQGLSGLEGQELENAKATTRLKILTEQTADAHGAAASEHDTYASTLGRVKARFEDLSVEIGQNFMPHAQDVLAWVDDMLPQWGEFAKESSAAFGELVSGLTASEDDRDKMSEDLTTWQELGITLQDTFGNLAELFQGGEGKFLGQTPEDIEDALSELNTLLELLNGDVGLGEALGRHKSGPAIWESGFDWSSLSPGILDDWYDQNVEPFLYRLGEVPGKVASGFGEAFREIPRGFGEFGREMGTLFGDLGSQITGFFSGGGGENGGGTWLSTAGVHWNKWLLGRSDSLRTWVTDTATKFDGLGATLGEKTANLQTNLSSGWQNIKETISNRASEAKNNASNWFSSLSTDVGTKTDNARSHISTGWQDIKTNISNRASEAKTNAGIWFSGLSTDVGTKTSNLGSNIATGWQNIKTNISNRASEAKNNAVARYEELRANWSAKSESIRANAGAKWASIKSSISNRASELKNNAVARYEELRARWAEKSESIRSNASSKWQSIKNDISSKSSAAKNAAVGAWNTMSSKLVSATNSMRDGIAKAWNRVKNVFRDPINAVVGFVNDPLISGVNNLLEKFGLKDQKISSMKKIAMATGGVLPGWSPGRDIHHFVNPSTGQGLSLSGGEGIMRPEWVRAVGGPSAVDYMNRAARRGVVTDLDGSSFNVNDKDKFAGGGVFWPAGTKTMSGNYSGHTGVDIAGPIGTPIYAPTAGQITHTGWGRGFGYSVRMRLASGHEAVFGHLQPNSITVPVGAMVAPGQRIAGMDDTGNSSGSHLHFEITSAGALGGASNRAGTLAFLRGADVSNAGGGGGFFDFVGDLFGKFTKPLKNLKAKLGDGAVGQLTGAVPDFLIERAQSWLSEKIGFLSGPSGSGSSQWDNVILQALAHVGQPASLLGTVRRRLSQESGGNPRAINNWDVNARNGVPSKGLMQVIGPTFSSYRDKSLPNDIWNPMSNIVASMNYAMRRYGSLASAYNRPGGYDNGGILNPGVTMTLNKTGKPEAILTNEQWAHMSRVAAVGERVLTKKSDGPHITVNGIKYDSVDDFVFEIERSQRKMDRRARYVG